MFEHFWREQPQLENLDEHVFGGLCQEIIKCKCGYIHELPIQKMAEIVPIHLSSNNIQSCIEAYLSSEEVDWRCPKCDAEKCLNIFEVICPPSSLILHLLRFAYLSIYLSIESINSTIILLLS